MQEVAPHILTWVALIRDLGLILGVPTLVVVALWLHRQHIAVLQARIETLEEEKNLLDLLRADRIVPALQHKHALEQAQLEAQLRAREPEPIDGSLFKQPPLESARLPSGRAETMASELERTRQEIFTYFETSL